MIAFPIRALLCLFVLYHFSSSQKPIWRPVTDFPLVTLWGNWYEIAFVDKPHLHYAYPCPIYSFHRECNANYYQIGFANGSVNASIFTNTEVLTITDQPGVFNLTTDVGSTGSITVLDYDRDFFEWIILGDAVTIGVFMTTLSRSVAPNEALQNRTREIAAEYDFEVTESNFNEHSKYCNYTGIMLQNEADRKKLEKSYNEGESTFKPLFTPVSDFPLEKLWGNWYEQALYDQAHLEKGDFCTIFSFNKSNNTNFYQIGLAKDAIDGPLSVVTVTIVETNVSGVYNITTSTGTTGSLTVIDYDPDYEWIILGDTITIDVVIAALSKSTEKNEELLDRASELAEKYNFGDNVIGQSEKCNYEGILQEQEQAREDWENQTEV